MPLRLGAAAGRHVESFAESAPVLLILARMNKGRIMLRRMAVVTIVGVVGVCLGAAEIVSAEPLGTISVNFRRNTGVIELAPTAVAGVVPVANWNNAPAAASGSGIALVDYLGAATSATMDYNSPGTWSVTHSGSGDQADRDMMNGYLDMGGDGFGQSITVTFANIPYALYDVYVYHSSSGGPNRSMSVTANGTTTVYTRNLSPADVFDGFVLDQHATLVDSNASATGGNYVKFSGLTGSSLTIVTTGIGSADGGYPGSDNTRRGPIQGIQITAVPEPSAVLLGVLGLFAAVGVFGRRRAQAS